MEDSGKVSSDGHFFGKQKNIHSYAKNRDPWYARDFQMFAKKLGKAP